MAETLQDACVPSGAKKWHWYNVKKDLVQQGGLKDEDVIINPLSVSSFGCGGEFRGNHFAISWVPNTLLMVTAQEYHPELVDAFARVVEYKPFAKYREPSDGVVTTEWAKNDSAERYRQLQQEGKLELTRLLE